ncbi:hypothetical protein FQN60_000032 [Etheostoma spectabile]|uniref:CS domain-containing protein n=1 Tax=Etheostoma spectabile TaxID=54343 RepID=A0A5J5CGK7_9PERO|nr:hypothetical protein FQN60_000032 [Etheostoma spectabile]
MASPLQMTEMYDNALLGILQHVGNIQDFLQVYFGFLYRKTDFYRLLSGFQCLRETTTRDELFNCLCDSLCTFKLFEKLAEHDRERLQSELQKREEGLCAPPAVQELEIRDQEEPGTEEGSPGEGPAPPSSSGATADPPPDRGGVGGPGPVARGDQEAAAGETPTENYNGAVRENYSWSQDYTDVEVRVRVSLQTGSLQVCVREGAEEKTLMEGQFTHKINTENSLWSLEPGHCVVKVHDMLKKGWDAEGSPFRGQQFDPSMFDIPPSAVQF